MSINIELNANPDDIAVTFKGKLIRNIAHISVAATADDNPAHATIVLSGDRAASEALAASIMEEVPWIGVLYLPTDEAPKTDGKEVTP